MNRLANFRDRARRQAAAVYKALRSTVHRRLHPGRHQRTRAQLRRAPRPRDILVICHGNICRSPYLEAVLRSHLPDITVTSAGFVGPDRSVPEHSLTVAARRGLDLSGHRSRLLTREMLQRAELVVVMDTRQARHLERQLGYDAGRVIIAGDLDPDPGDTRAIRDPWRQSLEVFVDSFARLDRCAATLTAALSGGRPRHQ